MTTEASEIASDSWEEVAVEPEPKKQPRSEGDRGRGGQAAMIIIEGDNLSENDRTPVLRQAAGAAALLVIITVWIIGALSPLLVLGLLWLGGPRAYTALAGLLAMTVYPYIASGSGRWEAVRRGFLLGQYWYRSCGRLYEKEGPDSWATMPPTLFCFHPHGVFTQGYILNGSLHPESPQIMGLLATVLFHAPVFRLVCGRWLDICAPSAKDTFLGFMKKGESFGILPGGFQEAAVSKLGTDRVWLRERKGFVKYALNYGYRLRPVYTFGECDTYWNAQGLWKLRLWLTAKNVPGVFPAGQWWCPLLSRRAKLMTVYGESLVLPKLEEPSQQDVDAWHAKYIEALVALHGRHKKKYASNPDAELDVW